MLSAVLAMVDFFYFKSMPSFVMFELRLVPYFFLFAIGKNAQQVKEAEAFFQKLQSEKIELTYSLSVAEGLLISLSLLVPGYHRMIKVLSYGCVEIGEIVTR